MKIAQCPNCRKENGFLAFRKVKPRNQKYPYICHYDSDLYEKQKNNYLSGKRKSKPTGRKCCSISLFSAVTLNFSEEWFAEYLKIIKKIHQKYLKYGFMTKDQFVNYCNRPPTMYAIKRIRDLFVKNPHWSENWQSAENLLQKAGYSDILIQKKIMKDIYFRFELRRTIKGFKHEFLFLVFLD